jgi:hypothetical protein
MANFLDEAEDVTEEVGYVAPTKKTPVKKQKSFLDDAPDLGAAPKNAGVDVDPSTFEKFLNVLDIPSSLVRTGVEAAISPERDVIPSLKEQAIRTIQSPTTAASTAPRGVDINKALREQSDILKPIRSDEPNPTLEFVGGFVTEMALDPTAWFMPSRKVTTPVRKTLESASERQAAKSIAKFASKADVLKEGADLDIIGARLVAEDLQGQIKNPVKLYQSLTGERHLQKIGADLPQTLQIRKTPATGGKISETSKEITNAISKVESEYGMTPQMPRNVMMKQLLENAKKNVSSVSGETVDLSRVEEILSKVLKPEQNIPGAAAGAAGDWSFNIPTEMSLTELHQLRKNVGKQVSDRAFYAAADASMRQETEVLRDLYRTLGDTIESNLRGKKLKVGNTEVDAADYYKGQNNKLKSFLDVQSMLEYQPTEALKSPDAAATVASMLTKGTLYGATAAGASFAGLPVNPLAAAGVGAGFGIAQAASEAVKTSTPEYLTSILKSMGKVSGTPLLPEAATRGTIQYMRDGEFVPTEGGSFDKVHPAFPFNTSPQDQIKSLPGSTMLRPKDIIKYRIPRSTDSILENKELVLAKIAQAGVPDELYNTIAYALNESPEQIPNVAPLIMTQFPTLFEQSKYKVFDGMIIDPNDKARMADDISKREDLNSIQRAKMISQINKTGKAPEGMV